MIAGDGGARAWLRGAAAGGRPDALSDTLVALLRRRGAALHVGRRADRVPLEGVGVAAIPLVRTPDGETTGVLVLHTLAFDALDVHGLATLTETGAWLSIVLDEAPRGIQRAGGVGLVA